MAKMPCKYDHANNSIEFIMRCKGVLTLTSVDKVLTIKCDLSNESYYAILPMIMEVILYKVVPTFESMDEILWCYHSNVN